MAHPGLPQAEQQHFGVSFEMMTNHVLHGIVAIYFEVALDRPVDPISLRSSYDVADIDRIYGTEYRIGSMLNRHSKLYIIPEGPESVLESFFYPNHQREKDESSGTAAHELGLSIGATFATRVDQLLLSLGIAEPLQRS